MVSVCPPFKMTIYSNNPVFAGHNVGSVQSRYIWPSQMIDVDIDVKRQAGRHPAGHHKEHKGWSAVTGETGQDIVSH